MRKRILTGLVLAVLLSTTISIADAWPLRIGLMACFGMAAFEIWASAAYGHLAGNSTDQKIVRDFRSKRYVYIQFALLLIAAYAIVARPIKPSEMLAVAIATYTADIGGYFAGTYFGKKTISFLRKISPKKTIEGYAGGIMLSWVATGVFLTVWTAPIPSVPKIGLWLLGGFVGCVGDLLGSATKRELGIKDADDVAKHMPVVKELEKLMTGHGGYLDRFDSLCLVTVFYYFLYLITGAL